MEVAAQMFANLDYDQTSFTAIAQSVGIQRASLYHYFPNKEALLMQIGMKWLQPLDQLVEQFNREGGPTDLLLYRYLRIDLRHIWSAPYNLGRLYQLPSDSESPETDPAWAIIETIHDTWTMWISEAVEAKTFRQVDPRLAGSLVESSYLGVIAAERTAIRRSPGQTADSFADLMLGGLIANETRLHELQHLAVELDGANPVISEVLSR